MITRSVPLAHGGPRVTFCGREVETMLDLVFILLTALFFAGTWGLVVLFGRLRGE
jgi:hypothetical protein